MAEKPINNSTIARIAGNIASGYVNRIIPDNQEADGVLIRWSVRLARAIVAEVERTDG